MNSTALSIDETNLPLGNPDQIILQLEQNFKKQAINHIVILFIVIPIVFSLTLLLIA